MTKIVNSKLLAMLIGAWITYCSMIGSYDGAVAILTVYLLTAWLDPFNSQHNKKSAGVTNTNANK